MYNKTASPACSPQHRSYPQRVIRLLALLWLLLAGICAGWAPSAYADAAGRFEILNASFHSAEGMWRADARAELRLGDATLEALDSGLVLTFQYQYEVTQRRRFLPDTLIAAQQQNIELRYLSLSQRYLVSNLDTGEQLSYATLFSALRQIGKVHDFPVVATALIDPENRNRIALRVVLNRELLPGPLQMLAFWRGDFSLESEWYRWTLR